MLDRLTTDELNAMYPEIEVEKWLSTGGQKKVYKGKRNGEDVVIKIMPIETVSISRRAEREIKCMQEIDSIHLVRLIDYFSDVIKEQDVIVMVEEYIGGTSLREIINNSPSLKQAILVLESLLNLLIEFDKKDIVHRDIKPENIIISEERGPVLLDFGIARVLNEESITATELPMAPGTLPYSSPEQLQNKKELQNVRTDLFSTGIVFFEVATGEYPFEYESSEELIDSILSGNRKRMTDYLKDIPSGELLDELFTKLTNPHPYERYRKPQFAIDMLSKIKEVINYEE